MKNTVSKLLKSYGNGNLSRRDLVQGLTLLAAGAGAAHGRIPSEQHEGDVLELPPQRPASAKREQQAVPSSL